MGEQNRQLNELVGEKEWLIKEIHHRVKNNLQIIISLLESQSDFLESSALSAIETSKNRIYAMSMIHQKLYQSDSTKTIDMGSYIPELVTFLSDIFDQGNRVKFILKVERLRFDIRHAIPLGLILNEVITNALKYAFEGREQGIVTITLIETATGNCDLLIADDGIGMPSAEKLANHDSLGMSLIRGLSRQLEADLEISSNAGTSFSIRSIAYMSVIGVEEEIFEYPT